MNTKTLVFSNSPGSSSVEALYNQALQLIKTAEDEEAIATFNRLLDIDPQHVPALCHLAFTLFRKQRPRQALTFYRRALRVRPDHPDIISDIANCYKALGDFPKARTLYEKAFKAQPQNPYTLFNLVMQDPHHAGAAAQLHALHQQPEYPRDMRMLVCFSLGKIYETRREYRVAFQYYDEANRLQGMLSSYNEKAFFGYCDMVQTAFDATLCAKLKNQEHYEITPIFILGMPRSGTSLVEQILASHSGVYGVGEVDIMPYAMEKMIPRLTGKPMPEAVHSLNQQLLAELADYYLTRLRSYCPNKSLYIVDKTPNDFFHIGLIRMLFPHAPIIHCVRDPMDNCWSIFKQFFNGTHPYRNDQAALGRYYLRYQEFMRHWHAIFPGEIHDVQYEQLVAEPEQNIRRILDYCGLPWEEKCLSFYRTDRVVNTASAAQVRRPIYKSAVKSWEAVAEELSPLRAALGMA